MKKIIIHTERMIPDENYLSDWFDAMRRTEIPSPVLSLLKKNGQASWLTRSGDCRVITTYKIIEENEKTVTD